MIINIFLQIKDTNFFQADRLQNIDEMIKKILRNNRGIINYLINIGFTSNMNLVKQKIDEYKNNNK